MIALPSTGLHTNGYSLARKVFEGRMNETFSGLQGTVGQELLKVHRSYLRVVEPFSVRRIFTDCRTLPVAASWAIPCALCPMD